MLIFDGQKILKLGSGLDKIPYIVLGLSVSTIVEQYQQICDEDIKKGDKVWKFKTERTMYLSSALEVILYNFFSFLHRQFLASLSIFMLDSTFGFLKL